MASTLPRGGTASSLVLSGVRIVSLALNLPGPAALMRLKQMGASCTKVEPPTSPTAKQASGDPMAHYMPQAYAQMHQGVRCVRADLKTTTGQRKLHALLSKADVLITSFRPSALKKLGLDWTNLQRLHPALNMLAIVGAPKELAEEPGHDLTYLAAHGLVTGLHLPATLYADMAGSLITTEAILKMLLQRTLKVDGVDQGVYCEVALSDAAAYLALPKSWGLTEPTGPVGGAHAGYRVYACKGGRVAVAALEPHFAARLFAAAGVAAQPKGLGHTATTWQQMAAFFAQKTRRQLDALAKQQDIPLLTMPR